MVTVEPVLADFGLTEIEPFSVLSAVTLKVMVSAGLKLALISTLEPGIVNVYWFCPAGVSATSLPLLSVTVSFSSS